MAGARVEDTNGTYRANVATTDTTGNTTYTPNTNKQDYINVFPSLQLKYTVNDKLQSPRCLFDCDRDARLPAQISAAETIVVNGATNGQNSLDHRQPKPAPDHG